MRARHGVYEGEELIAVFFSYAKARDYEDYLNRRMQTCRFFTSRISNHEK